MLPRENENIHMLSQNCKACRRLQQRATIRLGIATQLLCQVQALMAIDTSCFQWEQCVDIRSKTAGRGGTTIGTTINYLNESLNGLHRTWWTLYITFRVHSCRSLR